MHAVGKSGWKLVRIGRSLLEHEWNAVGTRAKHGWKALERATILRRRYDDWTTGIASSKRIFRFREQFILAHLELHLLGSSHKCHQTRCKFVSRLLFTPPPLLDSEIAYRGRGILTPDLACSRVFPPSPALQTFNLSLFNIRNLSRSFRQYHLLLSHITLIILRFSISNQYPCPTCDLLDGCLSSDVIPSLEDTSHLRHADSLYSA